MLGAQSSTSAAAEHDVARVAIKRMVGEYDMQVKDVNYDDSIFYKNLYNHLTTKFAILFAHYTNLLQEYNFVKDCYVTTLAQINEFVTERVQIRCAIEECYAVINRLVPLPPIAETDSSDGTSALLG
uniref:Uncharacterized protein n=1 Tax=Ananas comosus var. bracteatus TaxID=296719 RepID=A0A6V7PGG4_ANACO|nr:unnamed protein product [Ananas comosus var. bracteatus]